MKLTDKLRSENLQSDIVIIGGGAAGLTSAAAAAEAGIKNIIILEKSAHPGGNGALVGGTFATESPAQKRLGIKVSSDEVFKAVMAYNKGWTDAKMVRNYINKSGDIIRWLEGKGLNFRNVMEFGPTGLSPQVFHMFGYRSAGFIGKKVIETLVNSCQDRGVQLFCETTATKILTDGNGKVTGVLVSEKGKGISISAKGVIIAAGGFAGSQDLLSRYFPAHEDVYTTSVSQNTGDGLRMAEEAGAFIENHFTLVTYGPHCYQKSESPGTLASGHTLTLLFRRPDAILVNQEGERFIGEHLYGIGSPLAANALSRQSGRIGYVLLDAALMQEIIRKREVLTGLDKDEGDNGAWLDYLDENFQRDTVDGRAKISDSWDEIAGWMGVKPETLKNTIDQYNIFCAKGYDADFLKDKEYLRPLRMPPYYAVRGYQGFDTTLGGIKINYRMEVISKKDSPINGLYAAGDNAGGWASVTYDYTYPGWASGFAYYSGFTAGQNAAKYVLQ